jgi:uncharacterized membrane protein YqjE
MEPDGNGNGHSAHIAELRRQPLRSLVKEFASESSHLVQKEIELAKVEVQERTVAVGVGAGIGGVAAVAAVLAVAFGGLAAFFALRLVVADWLAALIVAAGFLVVGAICGFVAKWKITGAVPPAPETVETVQEDVQWAKAQRK